MNLYVIYILAALILVAFIGFHYRESILRRLGKESVQKEIEKSPGTEEKEEISQTESVRARVYDNLRRAIHNDDIPGNVVDRIKNDYGSLGRRWNKDGEELYAFNKTLEGVYSPVSKFMTITRENPPSKVHRALTQPETGIVFNVQTPGHFLQKYGAILLFAGFALFIMVLLILN